MNAAVLKIGAEIGSKLSTRTAKAALAILAVSFLMLGILHFNHNDFMYVVAPSLEADFTLYSELPFLQAPLTFHLFAAVHQLVDPEYYYAVLRLISIVFLMLSVYLSAKIANKFTSHPLSYLCCFWIVTSYYTIIISREVGNYSISLLLLILAVYVHFVRRSSVVDCCLIGLFIGLAASAKLNFALFAIPFGVFILIDHGLKSKHLAGYTISGLVGSGTIIYHSISDFGAFYFNNIQAHLITNIYREISNSESILLISGYTVKFLVFSLAPFLIFLKYFQHAKKAKVKIDTDSYNILLQMLVLVLVAFITAISPKVLFDQYLAPFLFLIAIAAAYSVELSLRLNPDERRQILSGCIGFSMACSLPFVASNLFSSAKSVVAIGVPVVASSSISGTIDRLARENLAVGKCEPTVLTLSPIPTIGTQLQISKLGSTGIFLPRIADEIQAHAPDYHHLVDVFQQIKQSPPTAIITGYYPEKKAERRLLAYANRNGYRRFPLGSFWHGHVLEIYFRPDCMLLDSSQLGMAGPVQVTSR